MKLVFLKMTLVLAAFPWLASGEENSPPTEQPIETAEPDFSYFEATGYRLEKHSDAPPVVAIHFDHCAGSPLAREKRITKGILIGREHILAPADDFIDPCSPPISLQEALPEAAIQTSNNYYCHDQRIKKISHLSLIPEPKPETEPDEAKQRARPAIPNIIRVLNELNFDGTHTIDALLCHHSENGIISPRPVLAVLSLSKRGIGSLPADITGAEIAQRQDDSNDDYSVDSTSLLLRNQLHFHNNATGAKPDQDSMYQLIEATRQLQLTGEDSGHQKFDVQPDAFISRQGDRHILHALVSDWELIDQFPSLTNLPDYAQRHPYSNMVWKASSPFTGTISHSLGMKSIPGLIGAAGGVLATVEIAGSATLIYLIASTLSSSIPIYAIIQVGLGLIATNGLYRWSTSEY
ncbi:hypothetical protein [Endozoicomonas sp.]|uniref:hypothetical protein n=1 Tax=Endozoicomonas sp. TaxID=1892382 RepID=UPI00383BC247